MSLPTVTLSTFGLLPLVAAHAAATFMMTGIITLVQYVHYPLFKYAAGGNFAAFHHEHGQRITWIVGPLMTIELASGCALAILSPCWLWTVCAVLSLLCFFLTGLVSVPLHNLLARGWDAAVHARLVRTNRWRTLAWVTHAALLLLRLFTAERVG